MNPNASLFSQYHSMQDQFTKLFLSTIVSRMDWSRESEDTVMDAGCGPGISTFRLLLPAFPNVRKIVAVDILPSMIAHAKVEFADPKIEFCEANVEDRSTMRRWKEQMTKVISIYCLHWLADQKKGFLNIYDVLKPRGEAALLIALKTSFWDPYDELIANPKWNSYLKDVNRYVPETNFMKDCSSHYKEMLKGIGFEIVFFEEQDHTYTFKDDNECKNSVWALSALVNHIPEDLKDEFKEDFFQGFLKYNPRNSDGRPNYYITSLALLLRKPEKH